MLDAAPSPAPPVAASLDEFFQRVVAVNPFTDNRINNPSADDPDVEGIHQTAFRRLAALAGEALIVRRGLGAVLWSEAGVGKSHVLSRLGRWADRDRRAVFVYLHNLQAAPDRLPRALLRTAVGLLTRGQRRWFHDTPLFRLMLDGLFAAVDREEGPQSWSRLRGAYDAMLDGLGRRDLPGATLLDRAVFDVLFQFFRSAHRAVRGREDGETAALAVRWLAGETLTRAQAGALGQPAAIADNQQIKQVLVALSWLAAAAGKPFVLAFDQVDNLEDDQFAALSRFLEALIDAAPNLLVVTAGVQASLLGWRERGMVQHSAWDRIAQFEIRLQRLSGEEALELVKVRLAAFLAPFAELEPMRQRLHDDPLFPLGRRWYTRWLQDATDVRPRDVLNWAREGWRREQDLLTRAGGPEWLAAWPGAKEDDADPERPPTPQEIEQAVDRLVEETLAAHLASVREKPSLLPPDADRLASLVHTALVQCRDAGARYGILSVSQVPQPKGARRAYDLDIVHRGEGEAPGPRTGVLVLTPDHPNAAAAALRRLTESTQSLRRLFLVTDERVKLELGERGAEYLTQLQRHPSLRFEQTALTFAEYAALDALQKVVGLARAHDLEVEPRRGRSRPVSEAEVVASFHRRERYTASRLLRELTTLPPTTAPVNGQGPPPA
jgi:hypothetical protein